MDLFCCCDLAWEFGVEEKIDIGVIISFVLIRDEVLYRWMGTGWDVMMNGVISALHFVYICSPLRWMDFVICLRTLVL